jgi:OmpA-OmpF porin, OOP family
MKMSYVPAACGALLLTVICGTAAEAQIGGALRDRARQEAERVRDRATQTEQVQEQVSSVRSAEPAAAAGASANARPGEGAWANYDYVPGERTIFADDFSRDRVGNFPQRFDFRSGNMEIVEWSGRRWMRAERGEFVINLPEMLPDRFTMEFDLAGHGNAMEINFQEASSGGNPRLEIGTYFARLRSGDVDGQGELGLSTSETPVRIRISADGGYLKLYANEKRALNVPNGNVGRSNQIFFSMNGWSADQPRLISDIQIAAGGRPLYDALTADGRVTTQGILFDTGSDRIRPESTPTLKEITAMLKEHGDLRILIEGHTDNVGQAEANQVLSGRRAEAVKTYLVGEGIASDRLEAQGLGASQPRAGNDTAEGRQTNRRVELVRR